jgi:gluconolactonase
MNARIGKTLVIGFSASIAVALGAAACSQAPTQSAASDAAGSTAVEAVGSIDRLDPGLDAILAPDAKIEKVATGFNFVEGPMWRDGRLWFSDLTGNKLYAVTPDGKVELLLDHSGGLETITGFKGSNGMVTNKDGKVILAQHGLRRLVVLDDKMQATPLVTTYEGHKINSPNDLVYHPDGSLWFTDPPFGLDKQDTDPAKELPFNGVYRYADGKLTAVIKDLAKPNGIGFSPDGKILYISNSGPDMLVKRFDVGANGAVTNGRVIISFPGTADDVPDGLKVDSLGDVWATGPGGIRIMTPDGKVLGQIKLPEVAANIAWGDDGSTAYITASTSIYRVRMRAPGEHPLYSR